MAESIPYVACWEDTSNITSTIAGTPGRAFVAGHKDLNLVLGVPMPEFLLTLVNAEKFALSHSIEIPMPPAMAITGRVDDESSRCPSHVRRNDRP